MSHPSLDELRQWHDGRLDHERERIVSHLAGCSACAARLASLVRAWEPEPRSAEVDLASYRAAALRVGDVLRTPRRAPSVRWLAMAATLVLTIGAVLLQVTRRPNVEVTRGDTPAPGVTLVSPVGTSAADASLAFRWNGTGGAVRLVVVDLDTGDAAIDRRVDGNLYTPDPAERERLRPGREYRWFVVFEDADGVSRQTPAARLSIR